jgi:hypothetical protein
VESHSWIPGGAEIRQSASVHRRPEQILVAVLGHPARSGEMTIVDATSALGLALRIDPEQDMDDLRPVRTFLGCVEQANVEREVLAIIVGHGGAMWRLIRKRRRRGPAGWILLRGFVSIHGHP